MQSAPWQTYASLVQMLVVCHHYFNTYVPGELPSQEMKKAKFLKTEKYKFSYAV